MSKRRKSAFSFRSSRHSSTTSISEGLKQCYRKVLRPFEELCHFHTFHTPALEDADFEAKPIVLLVGQYSTGKTTFIRYLLGEDFPGMRIGPEPTTDRFNIIMKDEEKRIVPGNALVTDPTLQFRPLANFGNAFLNRLQCSMTDSTVLNGMSLVDTPGILAGQKQSVDRGYDFTSVLQWFAARVDRILLLFDAHKLDISDELRRAILAIKSHDDKIRIVLNKSDLVGPQELMRVYGALMWSLGKVLETPEVVRVYIGSFWDEPLQNTENRELFEKEEHDLLQDLKGLPAHASLRRLNDFIKRARSAKIHGLIISELARSMPSLFGKERKKRELIESLGKIYAHLQEHYGVSPGDFPELSAMKEKLSAADWSTFKVIDKRTMDRLDRMLTDDTSKLMSSNQMDVENLVLNGPIEAVISANTPFQTHALSVDTELLWSNTVSSQPSTSNSEEEWAVAKASSDKFKTWVDRFNELNPVDGKLSGIAVKREFISKTKLPKAALSRIWTLCDIDQDGMLDQDEFCLAMYLIGNKINGKDLPHKLPDYMIPPKKKAVSSKQ